MLLRIAATALAVVLGTGLGRGVARSQSLPPRAESSPPITPARAQDWADRLLANDPKVRTAAEAALVQSSGRSLPLLRRLLASDDEPLREQTFEIIRQIGPPAIPLLVELLRHQDISFRGFAADALIDLAPDTESIQPALRQALTDADAMVAADAARALGALGERASPSVRALGDPIPGVRWAAGEALAGIGPAAQVAVPQLTEALTDEFLYVRICAAAALGSIGPKAVAARDALIAAAKEPALRDQAQWALNRITGTESREPVVSSRAPDPSVPIQPDTTVTPSGNPPVDWETATGRNIVWSVELGNEVYGRPVVAGGVVYVGADNTLHATPAAERDAGVLLAFQATDGALLWQDVAPRVERGLREWLLPATTSAPHVEGNRLYYVTAECQLRSLALTDKGASDIVWELDMPALGVFPHEACSSDVLGLGDLLVVGTSNGQNEGHTRVPSPHAPSVIAVNKHTGAVVWQAVGPGDRVLHGAWSSPVAATANGRVQVLHGGGDGWLRACDAASGREVWRFDGNPKRAPWRPRPGVLSRSSIIASPVVADGRVFIAMGQSPGHGSGPSFVHAIDPGGQGDVTDSRRLWTSREVGRVVGTPVVKDGLLFVGDLQGTVHCLDAATGAHLWKHETNDAIWGSL